MTKLIARIVAAKEPGMYTVVLSYKMANGETEFFDGGSFMSHSKALDFVKEMGVELLSK